MAGHFKDDADLVACATTFVRERVHLLNADVRHCIYKEPYAGFPALPYTMATLDLPGASWSARQK